MKNPLQAAGRRLLPWLGLLVFSVHPAAAQTTPASADSTVLTPVKLRLAVSPAIQVRVNLINAQGGRGRFVRRPNRDDAHGYLAAAAQGQNPKVVAHALKGMARSWSL